MCLITEKYGTRKKPYEGMSQHSKNTTEHSSMIGPLETSAVSFFKSHLISTPNCYDLSSDCYISSLGKHLWKLADNVRA